MFSPLFSFGCLGQAFLTNDFSVSYVATHSNSQLPWYYKASAIWGGHEGSFLLWTLIMAGWTLAVGVFARSLPIDMRASVLSVMGLLLLGFFSFLIFTSNPFVRSLPVVPEDGTDLNPLLQDFGLIVHPPMLYLGYVGFSVPFAFAIASLASGRLDIAWARWSRPWTNLAWAFLTLGILLGSWWAYYELGWGGWWFWDPVENASFMPWLVGTALMHSLAATEKRGLLRSWTVLLAIFTFSLSLLGAFLVRSGILTSVHAFAVDPTRGLFILMFLCLVVGGSLVLYALRAGVIYRPGTFTFSSREAFLLVNNVLLVVAAGSVLLGTLSPLAYETLTGGDRISVGPPYFNLVFVPLAVMLLLALVFAPASQWKRTWPSRLLRHQIWLAPLAVLLGLLWNWLTATAMHLLVLVVVCLSVWVLLTLFADWFRPWLRKRKLSALRRPVSYAGMWLGHAGLAVAVVGVAMTSWYSQEKDLIMRSGDQVEVGGYRLLLSGFSRQEGPNYQADQADVAVWYGDRELTRLGPQKRRYPVSGNVMTEADIRPGWLGDIYVAMGEPVGEGAWAMRVQYKPYVRWIWCGGLLAALGAGLTLFDRRYRRRPARAGSRARVSRARG